MPNALMLAFSGGLAIAVLGCRVNQDSGKDRSELTPPPAFATQISLGGSFETPEQGEAMAGFALLRPTDVAVEVHGGSVDVFPEIGLPRVRQGFTYHGDYFVVLQEPEAYPDGSRSGWQSASIGSFTGELRDDDGALAFRFRTEERIHEQVIVAEVIADGVSESDFRQFVQTLSYGDAMTSSN